MVVAAATAADAGPKATEGDPLTRAKQQGAKGRVQRKRRKGGPKDRVVAKAGAPAKPAVKAVKKPVVAKKGGDALDSLIDNALGKERIIKATPKVAAPPKPVGKTALTKNDIRAGMKKVGSQVQTCYDKYQIGGTAWVKLTITPKGMPKNIRIKGKFLGTDTGNCVIKAVKRARFATFSGQPSTVNYPFRLEE